MAVGVPFLLAISTRRHLALVCFLHQTWRDTLDQAVDMYGKLLDRNRKLVETRLDDMLKAQRQAVDRIVHRYRQLGAVGAVRNRVCAVLQAPVGALLASTGAAASTAAALARGSAFG